jgi:hypothetical protein
MEKITVELQREIIGEYLEFISKVGMMSADANNMMEDIIKQMKETGVDESLVRALEHASSMLHLVLTHLAKRHVSMISLLGFYDPEDLKQELLEDNELDDDVRDRIDMFFKNIRGTDD